MSTLWLVGMMGAGKSTVGPLVAARLGRRFVDLDDVVAADAGRTVGEIFAAEGETGFRRRETEALSRVAGTDVVVACGGGIVVDAANVALLQASGMVAWLQAPAEVLASRVGDGGGRPLLEAPTGNQVSALLAARQPAYEVASHCRVPTDGRLPGEVADEVVRRWNEFT